MFKQKLFRWHFYALLLVVINSIIRIFDFRIISWIMIPIIIFLFLSAAVLFFLNIRPFKRISLYFSLYILTPILTVLSFLTDGIAGALLTSIFIFTVVTGSVESKFKSSDFRAYNNATGLFDQCCGYDVYKKQLLLLEKKIATVIVRPADSLSLHVEDNLLKFIQYDKIEGILNKSDSVIFDLKGRELLTIPQSP